MLLWIILFSTTVVILSPLYLLGRIAKKRVEEIKARFDENDIILATSRANFFGQESMRCEQVRGKGYLILTRDVLFFRLLILKREIVIPVQAVTSAEITSWHIGKSKRRLLLKVIFTNENGSRDSAAWLIGDPNKWKEEIEELVAGDI